MKQHVKHGVSLVVVLVALVVAGFGADLEVSSDSPGVGVVSTDLGSSGDLGSPVDLGIDGTDGLHW
jgi:hypothetical protein